MRVSPAARYEITERAALSASERICFAVRISGGGVGEDSDGSGSGGDLDTQAVAAIATRRKPERASFAKDGRKDKNVPVGPVRHEAPVCQLRKPTGSGLTRTASMQYDVDFY